MLEERGGEWRVGAEERAISSPPYARYVRAPSDELHCTCAILTPGPGPPATIKINFCYSTAASTDRELFVVKTLSVWMTSPKPWKVYLALLASLICTNIHMMLTSRKGW